LILLIQLKIIFKVDHLIQLSGYSTSDQIGTSLLIMGDVFRRYFYNLIMPIALSVTYITPEITLSSMKGIATLIFILSIFILLFFLVYWANEKTYRKKISPWLFWIAWFFAALLPVSQLVGLENKMADRYLLFPSLSYAFLLPYGFYQAYTNQWLKQKTSTVLLFMVALFYATLTFQQVSFWKNSEILWLHAVQLEPQDQKALYQLSMNYKDQRLLDRERVVLEVLLQVNPQHEKALNNYAINLYQQNPADPKILSTYQQLIKINPKNTKALQNYGFILLKRGDHAQAITLLLQAIQHDPNYCLALEHLSEAYLAAKNKSEATIYADRTQGCKEKNAAR
jgi:Tfp pilus assembly protein PilF